MSLGCECGIHHGICAVDATLSAYPVTLFLPCSYDGRVRFNIPQVKDTQDNSS